MPILGDLYDILITTPETKRMANILNRLVHGSASTFNQRMEDDTGLLVDAYNTTEIGETDCTHISVMGKEHFPKWLSEREKSLKTISDF